MQDHDLTHSPTTVSRDGAKLKCCGERRMHPDCFPITTPREDPFFRRHNKQCLSFVRSLQTSRHACKLGPREQLNQLTSFIDASNLYGSTTDEANYLRSFEKGQLRTSANPRRPHGGKALLPPDLFISDCQFNSTTSIPVNNEANNLNCFKAGKHCLQEQYRK